MHSIIAVTLRTWLFGANCLLWSLAPYAAMAASASIERADPANVPTLTYVWVVIFSLLGWSAASLASFAKWVDGFEARLLILQGMCASIAAGLCAFFSAQLLGQSEMAAYMLVMAAGFGGEKALRRYFDKARDSK